jgi:protein Shroom
VADRRRIFERDGKACSTLSLSGPELKQFQQSALADYIQRKTGKRPTGAACTPEAGLRERAQSAYLQAGPAAPDGPGLASACSLSSLREPEALPRKEHTHPSAADGPQAPRDRSSSFASGRLVGERRRWDPQVPRQLLSGANCEPRGVQRMDGAPGGPPSWGMVAGKAGKSKSAEDLLERSDTLAVPVHVRSRSSPTSDKKGQVGAAKPAGLGLAPSDSDSFSGGSPNTSPLFVCLFSFKSEKVILFFICLFLRFSLLTLPGSRTKIYKCLYSCFGFFVFLFLAI